MSGISRLTPDEPSTGAPRRPISRSAGSTIGSRNTASASLPNGNDATRSAMLTSLVTPPAPTRISRSTSCGNW